jgi:hypothetical protein
VQLPLGKQTEVEYLHDPQLQILKGRLKRTLASSADIVSGHNLPEKSRKLRRNQQYPDEPSS